MTESAAPEPSPALDFDNILKGMSARQEHHMQVALPPSETEWQAVDVHRASVEDYLNEMEHLDTSDLDNMVTTYSDQLRRLGFDLDNKRVLLTMQATASVLLFFVTEQLATCAQGPHASAHAQNGFLRFDLILRAAMRDAGVRAPVHAPSPFQPEA